MQGYKTYTGLVIVFLGWLGIGDLVSEQQTGEVIDLTTQLVGLGIAIYGNYKSHRELKALGGYR